jgi:hypothetical protein
MVDSDKIRSLFVLYLQTAAFKIAARTCTVAQLFFLNLFLVYLNIYADERIEGDLSEY